MTMGKINDQIAGLATLSAAALGVEWRRLRKELPPAQSVDLIRRGLGWHLQAEQNGGLSPEAERELTRLAGGSVPVLPVRARASLRPGTRLVRSWHGKTYAVLVTEGGFDFDGRSFTSLTTIAREITGAAWSGPRFFGLNAPSASAATRSDRAQAPTNA
jgi:hypothetical protein